MEPPTQELTFQSILAILQRRWWITALVFVWCVIIAILTLKFMPRIYEANSQIQVRTPTPQVAPGIPGVSAGADIFKQTQLALLSNSAVSEEIDRELANTYALLRKKGIFVHPASYVMSSSDRRGTDLIDIAVRSTDPVVAMYAANATATAFRQYRQDVEREAAQADTDAMRARVNKAKDDMLESSAALAEFQNRHGIVSLSEQTKGKISDVSLLETKLKDAQEQLQSAQTTVDQLQGQVNAQGFSIRTKGERSNGRIDALRVRLDQQQEQLRQAEQRYVNLPAVWAPLRQNVEQTREELNRELNKATSGAVSLDTQDKLLALLQDSQVRLAALRTEVAVLEQQSQRANAALQDLPNRERQYAQLSQTADVNRDLYTKAMESQQQIQMESLSHPSTIIITQTAKGPGRKVSPKTTLNLMAGVIAGLILGLLSALLIDHIDEAVHSEKDLRRLVPALSVLGILPVIPKTSLDEEKDGRESIGRAPYRLLWTNLGFAAVDSPIRRVILTSAVMGEGKSLTSAFLARSGAEEGKKVVLVDCDLRRPSQHKLFNLHEKAGLCELLAGKVRLQDVLYATDDPNLFVLPAGQTLPLNPQVLLGSERMAQILDELDHQCDFVVLDAPPILAVADALLLGSKLHVPVVQVVESGRAKPSQVLKVVENIARARLQHLGLILNKVPKRSMEGYGYYYYYYYYYRDEANGAGGQNGHRRNKRRAPSSDRTLQP